MEAIDRRQHPGIGGRIPVVHVTVPPAATSRMLAVEFVRFLGLPVTVRANITDVIEAVCGVLIDTRVTVVCVAELRDLSRATRSGAEVSDTLKYFTERIPATFVYAGVDLEAKGLFNGTRGRQIAGRFGVIETNHNDVSKNDPLRPIRPDRRDRTIPVCHLRTSPAVRRTLFETETVFPTVSPAGIPLAKCTTASPSYPVCKGLLPAGRGQVRRRTCSHRCRQRAYRERLSCDTELGARAIEA
ncbi:TniB family NTP-binding protein [Streptomyces sp. NPDC092295]|uniref:TniB family NTP-binding protein n=1 Tax=Streptomyces sp. NPDC092295 TaxID=3366011 RepID=UPI0037FF9BCF